MSIHAENGFQSPSIYGTFLPHGIGSDWSHVIQMSAMIANMQRLAFISHITAFCLLWSISAVQNCLACSTRDLNTWGCSGFVGIFDAPISRSYYGNLDFCNAGRAILAPRWCSSVLFRVEVLRCPEPVRRPAITGQRVSDHRAASQRGGGGG